MTSPSRLSSLLVRDGVVGVKRLEQAFQRQVIYGGALDTILLEMNVLDEAQVAGYLAQSSGVPAAEPDLLGYFDPRAVQICPRTVAELYRVAPVAFAGETLRVVTMDPVDFGALEGLATHISTPVQPFVTPELRFYLLIERLFGVPTPPRFVALATRLAATAKATSSTDTVVVQDAALSAAPRAAGKVTTAPMSSMALAREVERQEQQRRSVAAARPPSEPIPVAIPITPAAEVRRLPPTVPLAVTLAQQDYGHNDGTPSAQLSTEAVTPRLPRGQHAALYEASAVVRTPWRGGHTVDPRALEPRAAADLLAQADDRDAVFGALLRGVCSRASYAAVLVVQGDMAYGRLAMGIGEVDTGVVQVAIPTERVPAFKTVLTTRSPYIGPVGTGEVSTDAMVARLGQRLPPSALVMPILIRDRAVALVYAHRGIDPVSIAEVAEVLPLASEAALALSRLILRAKSEGYRKERAASAGDAPVERADVPVKSRPEPQGPWGKPETAAPPVSLRHDDLDVPVAPLPQAPRRPIEAVLDAIEQGGIGAAEALDEAVRRADEVLPRLRHRLPGRLWIDRHAPAAKQTRASQHGPLLALTVRLGERAVPLLAELIGAEPRELRYYATLACCEVRSPALTLGLATRLFDADHGVRAAAIDALAGYPPREIDGALTAVRASLFGKPEHARTAAYGLGELRDIGAIPALIDILQDGAVAEDARRALVVITKQDFGIKARKWRSWWEREQDRPRIEWLLDGLAHHDDGLRQASAEELNRLTGESFGDRHDLPRAQRDEARHRWLVWWETTGRTRFLGGGSGRDERTRPTAILPERR